MEKDNVYAHQLLEILRRARDTKVFIKVLNHSEKWTENFFQILEIKDIRDKDYQVTVIILFDPETSDATALDLKTISGVEFDGPLNVEGVIYRKIAMNK